MNSLLNKDYLNAEYKPVDKTNKSSKIVENMDSLFDKLDLKDGAAISFHHHLRNGDFVTNMIMAEIKKEESKI